MNPEKSDNLKNKNRYSDDVKGKEEASASVPPKQARTDYSLHDEVGDEKEAFPEIKRADLQVEQQQAFVTRDELINLGAQEIVYLKPMTIDEVRMELRDIEDAEALSVLETQDELYGIHAANGTRVAIVQSKEAAILAAHQYDMKPLSLH